MPRPALLIELPQPCQERWDAMTPATGDRHCAACQQVVVDFTAMTDGELAAYLGRAGRVPCGRFRASQLGRPLLPAAVPVAGWRRWLGTAAALLGLGAVAAPARVQAQQGQPATGQAPVTKSQPGQAATAAPAGTQPPATAQPEPMVLGGMPIVRPTPPARKPKKGK